MQVTHNDRTINADHHAPLAIGNGALSLLVDEFGATRPRKFLRDRISTGIWIAGIRYDKPCFPLVSFGGFSDTCAENSKLEHWSQTFDITGAAVECCCDYSDGTGLRTRIWTPFGHNFVVIEKEILRQGPGPVAECYSFAPSRTRLTPAGDTATEYEIDTFLPLDGRISFFAVDGEAVFSRHAETISGVMRTDRVVFVLAFDADSEMYARSHRIEELRALHEADWQNFWTESTVPENLPERMKLVAKTSEYHLRISSTDWSIPVGIYPSHWEGKYFGFDVYFCVMGLLRSGHAALAAKVPRYYAEQLTEARKRNYFYFGRYGSAARYPWEGIELPLEGARSGFWLEHVFHMTHIGLSAAACAETLNDRQYTLECAYPVMRGCAEFFRLHQVYKSDDGRCIIGKCTDLERLGAGRENPFMTSCGAITLFNKTADMAERLGCDAELVREWREMAAGLRSTLPQDETRYLPYPGCNEPSIALFSGLYPYEVLDPKDRKLQQSIDWFCSSERQFGNMYPVGDALCIWYAGWKALALLRQGAQDEARALVRSMAEATGNFGEVFEIYETGHHPWFTTAEGIYLQSVCECFYVKD